MVGVALKRIDHAEQHELAERPLADVAEAQYRSLIDQSPVAMGVHADGRYVYVYVNQTLVRRQIATRQHYGRYEPAARAGDRHAGRHDA